MATVYPFRNVILTIALLITAVLAHAQIIITGKVTDAETGKAIPGASVYFNGTYVGTATDSLGAFTLKTSKTSIPLVVSFIGYETRELNHYSDSSALSIALSPKVDQLKQVNITVDEMSRKNKLKIFLTEFLGEISNDCIISNPDVLWLRYNKRNEELTAGAEEPLIIKNKKLGYQITYYLDGFRHALYHTDFQGNYLFTEDTTGLKPKAIEKILKARDDVYYGSRMHFIRALWANQLALNKYKIYKPLPGPGQNNITGYRDEGTNLVGYDSLVLVKNDKVYRGQKFLVFDKEIYVQYQPNKNDLQTSFIKRSDGSAGTIIDKDGYYSSGIEWKGYMGFSRVNCLLPTEFVPETIK